ncbi:MAG: peptidylprolyl isomerase [Syntrophales bacterium]
MNRKRLFNGRPASGTGHRAGGSPPYALCGLRFILHPESRVLNLFAAMLLAALIFSAPIGCRSARDYVAVVDGEKIYLQEFNERLSADLNVMGDISSLDEGNLDKIKRELLGQMIDEKIMIHHADKLGIQVSDEELAKKIDEIKSDYASGFDDIFKEKKDFKNWKEKLKNRILLEKLIARDVNAAVVVSDEEALRYYNSHPEERILKERVRISQIVVESRDQAENALKRLRAGEDFAKVAQEVSIGPERVRGGELGYFAKGVLPETFDRVIFLLRPGMISEVVETPYGFHIFKVVERIAGGKAGFAEVKNTIKAKLKGAKEEEAYNQWLGRLRSQASVSINEAVLKRAGKSS